jgi:hypothetical protein
MNRRGTDLLSFSDIMADICFSLPNVRFRG